MGEYESNVLFVCEPCVWICAFARRTKKSKRSKYRRKKRRRRINKMCERALCLWSKIHLKFDGPVHRSTAHFLCRCECAVPATDNSIGEECSTQNSLQRKWDVIHIRGIITYRKFTRTVDKIASQFIVTFEVFVMQPNTIDQLNSVVAHPSG